MKNLIGKVVADVVIDAETGIVNFQFKPESDLVLKLHYQIEAMQLEIDRLNRVLQHYEKVWGEKR